MVLNTGTKDWMHIQLESMATQDGLTASMGGHRHSGSDSFCSAFPDGFAAMADAFRWEQTAAQRCGASSVATDLNPWIRWAELWRQRKMQSKQPGNSLVLRTCGVGKRPLVSTAQGWCRWPGN